VELRWWPVFVAGLLCLAMCIALAAFLPMPQHRGRLRPLAHADRLTRLPEYIRVVRLQFWSMLVIVVLLLVMYSMALVTSSRPIGFTANDGVQAQRPETIMVCAGARVTDPATAAMLNYFTRQIPTFDTQRIGLTSESLRVVPLTRDYLYAASKFGRFAKLAALQDGVDAGQPVSPGQQLDLRNGGNEFSRPLAYVDYARSVEDILALCMAGFPSFEDKNLQRRSLIYLGPSDSRAPDEQRPSLFSAQQVQEMAAAAGIQVNLLTGSGSSPQDDRLRSIAADTGGKFATYDGGGTNVAATLDSIRANPPRADSSASAFTGRLGDYPNVALITGIVVSALLCMCLVVLRR
jgi:hypothetical protein